MDKVSYEIKMVCDPKKATLKQLADMVISHQIRNVYYLETTKGNFLMSFLLDSNNRILDTGENIIRKCITEIIYHKMEVEISGRIILRNFWNDTCSFVEEKEHLPEATFSIRVVSFPSPMLKKIEDAIVKAIQEKS